MTKTRSKGKAKGKNPHWGSTLDEFLEEDGTREAFRAVAIKEVLAWQIKKAIKARGLSRNRMAKEMRTEPQPDLPQPLFGPTDRSRDVQE